MSVDDARARAQRALAMLTARYRADAGTLCDRFAAISARLAADPADAAALEALLRDAHRTHGTAGSLGFDAASLRCGEMEERVEQWRADPALERSAREQLVAEFAAALRCDFGIDGATAAE